MSYFAGCPAPSVTSVRERVTELSVTLETARSATVAGLPLGAVTVIADVPLFPSLVAVIVADPAATPLTRPLPFTVATEVLLLAQVTTRPLSGLPPASLGVAASCTVCPTVTLAVTGLTVTDATGIADTVTAAVPFLPSLVAVIVADPAATPLTRPLPLTVATEALLLASLGVAVNCTVCPTVTLADAGLTATDATGALETVTPAVPLWPSLVAVIVAEPAATPVTTPLALTVATATLLLAHVTVRPLSTFPAASFVVAESVTDWPTCSLADAGLTITDATGAGVTVTTAVSEVPPGFPWAPTLTLPVSAPALYRP